MHPVIKHILARKNKSVPINDNRHITLLLFSGLMKGVRGGGAMTALEELGLSQVFDSVYTFSAGFANASYLLSGNAKLGVTIYYQDLIDSKFINFKRFWKIADIEYVVNVIKNIKPINVKNILSSKTNFFVRVKNKTKGKDEYLEVHDFTENEYFDLLKAAISIPILHPGGVRIRGQLYDDAARLDRSHISDHYNYVLGTSATDILCIYNDSTHVQGKDSERVFSIYPNTPMSLYETNSEILESAAIEMATIVKSLFASSVF